MTPEQKAQKLQEYNAILTAILLKQDLISFEQFYLLLDAEIESNILKAQEALSSMDTKEFKEFKEFKEHYTVTARVGKYSAGDLGVI